MQRVTLEEVEEAAAVGEGFCLSCGERQHFPEFSNHQPLCVGCDEYEVVSAGMMLAVINFVEEGE